MLPSLPGRQAAAHTSRPAHPLYQPLPCSRVMEDSAVLSSVAATNPRWLAPEILSGKGYTKGSDVYSFG